MSHNFITSGFINPGQWSWEQVRTEVAQWLKIPIQQIERLELWKHQIWIKFVQGRGKFISYRNLPLWLEAGLMAVARCKDEAILQQLAQAIAVEKNWSEKSQDLERKQKWQQVIERWHYAWGEKAKQLELEEERLRPLREHQQAAQKWREGWQEVLEHWEDGNTLQYLTKEIERQSRKFADLPEIIEQIREILQQRWIELTRRHGDTETRRRGDAETRRRGLRS